MGCLPIFALGLLMSATPPAPRAFTFDGDKLGMPPAGWTFARGGEGAMGRWVVVASSDKGRGGVLTQAELEPNKNRFLLALSNTPPQADGSYVVRCKAISGTKDQDCGLIFRVQDASNYYLVRMDALAANIRLYAVKNGTRARLAEFPGTIKPGVWHELRVYNKADRIVAYFNDLAVMDVHDRTHTKPGRAGLWTKSDARVEFDDFSVGAFVEYWEEQAKGRAKSLKPKKRGQRL